MNCPYTADRIYSAIMSLRAIRENQDCLIELDRLDSLVSHDLQDDIASAIAYAAQAYEKLKGVRYNENG